MAKARCCYFLYLSSSVFSISSQQNRLLSLALMKMLQQKQCFYRSDVEAWQKF